MTASPMTGPWIPAKGYSAGRRGNTVKWVVLHTAEGSTNVQSLGNYFAGTTAGSSHCGLGQSGEYAEYVRYADTAWTNPSINTQSDTAEMCAFRAWSRQEWLNHPKLLEAAAHWVAWRCSVRGIPIRLITGAQAAAGVSGVLDHKRVNDGFHASDHTDVGPTFPWDIVIPRAQALAGAPVAKAAQPQYQMAGKDRWLGVYQPPMTGQDVANVQHALNLCGNSLAVDGVYKQVDAEVLQTFQQHRSIDERGCGPKTWEALRAVPGVH